MPIGNDCPACGEDIGIWAVFKAPMPNRIYCPHCGERLRYGGTAPLTVAVVVLSVGVGLASLAAFVLNLGDLVVAVVAAAGLVVAGLVAIEVVFVLILWYGGYRLEPVNPPRADWDDEEF